MKRVSDPILAVSLSVLTAVVLAFACNAAIAWIVSEDWALADSAFQSAASTVASGPFGDTAAAEVDTARDALRETLGAMLSGHGWVCCGLVGILGILWVVVCATVKIRSPKEDSKGRPYWLGLLLTVVLGTVAVFLHAIYIAVPGDKLSAEGQLAVGLLLVGLPLIGFVVVSRLTTPPEACKFVPF